MHIKELLNNKQAQNTPKYTKYKLWEIREPKHIIAKLKRLYA